MFNAIESREDSSRFEQRSARRWITACRPNHGSCAEIPRVFKTTCWNIHTLIDMRWLLFSWRPVAWYWLFITLRMTPHQSYVDRCTFLPMFDRKPQTPFPRFVVDLLYNLPTLQQWLSRRWNTQQMYSRTSYPQRPQQVHNKSTIIEVMGFGPNEVPDSFALL